MRTRQQFKSVPDRRAGRNLRAGGEPLIVGLELQAELVIEHPQRAVAAAHDRIGHYSLHFLRHHADIGLVAAIVAEAIEAEAVVEMAKERDVVLEHHVGSPAATTATAAATTTAAATDAATATAAAADAATATATDATNTTATDAANATAA